MEFYIKSVQEKSFRNIEKSIYSFHLKILRNLYSFNIVFFHFLKWAPFFSTTLFFFYGVLGVENLCLKPFSLQKFLIARF